MLMHKKNNQGGRRWEGGQCVECSHYILKTGRKTEKRVITLNTQINTRSIDMPTSTLCATFTCTLHPSLLAIMQT